MILKIIKNEGPFSNIIISPSMSAQKIVLMEDDEVLGKVLKEELTESGFSVAWAKDGEAGIAHIRKDKPDLALLDILMPKKNGFDVLAEIKRSPATKDIPVIMLTMLGADDDLKRGVALGANDYIVKSQHAIGEIRDKVKEFFKAEQHPEARHMQEGADVSPHKELEKRAEKIKE